MKKKPHERSESWSQPAQPIPVQPIRAPSVPRQRTRSASRPRTESLSDLTPGVCVSHGQLLLIVDLMMLRPYFRHFPEL